MTTSRKPWIAAGVVFAVGIIAWHAFLGRWVHEHWERALCRAPGCLGDLVTQPSPVLPMAAVALAVAALVAFAQAPLPTGRTGLRLLLWLAFETVMIALAYAALVALWSSPYRNIPDLLAPPPVDNNSAHCRDAASQCWALPFAGTVVFAGAPIGFIVMGGWISIRLLVDALTTRDRG